jgi:hypothetical protein
MPLDGVEPFAPEPGCLYLGNLSLPCGCAQQLGSSYCAVHHALCHVVPGSRAELACIAEIEIAAAFVGGRLSRFSPVGGPPGQFMRALDARQRRCH